LEIDRSYTAMHGQSVIKMALSSFYRLQYSRQPTDTGTQCL